MIHINYYYHKCLVNEYSFGHMRLLELGSVSLPFTAASVFVV